MDILSRFLFLVIISSMSFVTPGAETRNKKSGLQLQLDKNKKIGTSEHLQNVVEFYNDTFVILEKIKKILKYEPLKILQEAVLNHVTSLKNIISKLEEHLKAAKNGINLNNAEHSAFMTSINEEINGLRDESEKLAAKMEKSTVMEKSIGDRKEVIDLLTKIHKKNTDFESRIRFLEAKGIVLSSSDNQPPRQERFQISNLIRLGRLYKEIESIEDNDASAEFVENNSALEKNKLLAAQYTKEKAEVLKQFVPTIQAMKKRIVNLIPETEEMHNKIVEEVMLKALGALELEKQMESLLQDLKLMTENTATKSNKDHEEL